MSTTDGGASASTPGSGGRSRIAEVIEKNIETLERVRAEHSASRGLQDRVVDAVTGFSGHVVFLYVHIVWFAMWIGLNSGVAGLKVFDPFPYGLLTMIVSLEAIFLSTIVLISQNRMSELSERRNDLALQISLLTEYEVTRSLRMLHAIHEHMHVLCELDPDEAQLETETSPEDVLAEIERLHFMSHRITKK